ncbi:hypothetical protein ACFRQM_48865 [Streptomyces sp. NPDC056831]|uniref:hypothetical protein n=1 Tax=Streptomyces sp. NPDC056831 TaxID=3345954 RepID=UPI0036832A4E
MSTPLWGEESAVRGFSTATVALRIHNGAFPAMGLTARHPGTGELLSTGKFTAQTVAAGD